METDLVARKVLEQALIYEKRHGLDPLRPDLSRQSLVALLSRIQRNAVKTSAPLRVLEVGCGAGVLTAAVAMLGHRALGLEFHQETVHLAKFFVQEQNLDGQFLLSQGEISAWENEVEETLGGKPDLIVLANLADRGYGVEPLVGRLSGWMKPGKKILLLTSNPTAPPLRARAAVTRFLRLSAKGGTVAPRSYRQWEQLLSDAGFQVSPPRGVTPVRLLGRLMPGFAPQLLFEATRP